MNVKPIRDTMGYGKDAQSSISGGTADNRKDLVRGEG
jgi:hypothetical protein